MKVLGTIFGILSIVFSVPFIVLIVCGSLSWSEIILCGMVIGVAIFGGVKILIKVHKS